LDSLLFKRSAEERQSIFVNLKHGLVYYANQIETILGGELAVQNCYLVRPKRAYDIEMLAEDGLKLFSDEVQAGLTDLEKYDLRQGTRCIAFEVPTAAMFHFFRAADSILRRWYKLITGTEPPVKMRSWGTYLVNLKKCAVNVKITSALEQIKDLHRNPVVHPEAMVSIEEALSFIGIAESVISAMVLDIHERLSASAQASLFEVQASFPPLPSSASGVTLLGAPLGEHA